MHSDAATVEDYLAELPPERREAIERVRSLVLERLPDGYEERMQYGMISYVVPWEVYSTTYNGQPLAYVSLASQKRHMALYLNSVYAYPEQGRAFEERYRASGKRLDMGKSCVRFKRVDDLPFDVIGDTIAETPVAQFVATYEDVRLNRRR